MTSTSEDHRKTNVQPNMDVSSIDALHLDVSNNNNNNNNCKNLTSPETATPTELSFADKMKNFQLMSGDSAKVSSSFRIKKPTDSKDKDAFSGPMEKTKIPTAAT